MVSLWCWTCLEWLGITLKISLLLLLKECSQYYRYWQCYSQGFWIKLNTHYCLSANSQWILLCGLVCQLKFYHCIYPIPVWSLTNKSLLSCDHVLDFLYFEPSPAAYIVLVGPHHWHLLTWIQETYPVWYRQTVITGIEMGAGRNVSHLIIEYADYHQPIKMLILSTVIFSIFHCVMLWWIIL